MDRKQRLKLTGVLSEVPDWYLDLAFTEPHDIVFEDFEFFGDAVYELVIQQFVNRTHASHSLYDSLRSNHDQACLFSKTGLCSGLPQVNDRNHYGKPCADRLEAIIGVLYSYLVKINHPNPISIIGDWLVGLLELHNVKDYLDQGIKVPCGDNYHFLMTIREAELRSIRGESSGQEGH